MRKRSEILCLSSFLSFLSIFASFGPYHSFIISSGLHTVCVCWLENLSVSEKEYCLIMGNEDRMKKDNQQRNRKLFRKKELNEWSEEDEVESFSRSQYGANR
jgi:hypothetical protein